MIVAETLLQFGEMTLQNDRPTVSGNQADDVEMEEPPLSAQDRLAAQTRLASIEQDVATSVSQLSGLFRERRTLRVQLQEESPPVDRTTGRPVTLALISRLHSPAHQINGNRVGHGDREIGELFDSKYQGLAQYGGEDVLR